jgi:hypothetical protein
MIVNDARGKREIKSRVAKAKAAFAMEKDLFASKLDMYLRKQLVTSCIWSIALYGAETWALREVDQKYLESLKCFAGDGWRLLFGQFV